MSSNEAGSGGRAHGALSGPGKKRNKPSTAGGTLHLTPTGTEHTADSSGNRGVAVQGGAKSGALSGNSAPIDPDLALVVNAWPTLPEATRRQVVAMVRAQNG